MIKINDTPSRRELRQFAAIWFPVFWLIVAAVLYFAAAPRAAVGAALFGVTIGGIGTFEPRFMHPIYLIWMYAAYPIGFVVSHLLLGAIFYLVLTPIGLIMKIVGYDPLERRLRASGSYWVPYERVTDNKRYFRQF